MELCECWWAVTLSQLISAFVLQVHDQWRLDNDNQPGLELTSSCSSEGVQIGGVCSAAGIVGSWSRAVRSQGRFLLPSPSPTSWTDLHYCQMTP